MIYLTNKLDTHTATDITDHHLYLIQRATIWRKISESKHAPIISAQRVTV